MPHTQTALATWPRCRYPVGAGAKRVLGASGVSEGIWKGTGEAPARIELANRGFADLCLTTWLRRREG